MKPYFYAFRLAKDTDEKELRWIKNSQVTLCTNIEPQYKHHEELKDFELKPYEFIYLEKKNEVFLLIDDSQNHNTIQDLKSDYRFAGAIAEVYSSILKVDAHRVSFARLFEANGNKRNYLISTDLDDKDYERLSNAKRKLNVVDDPKTQFWFSILSSMNKQYEYRKYQDSEFKELVLRSLNLNPDDYKLNYNDINDISNCHVIIELFKHLKIDIPKFSENSSISLNIIPFYEDQVRQLKNDNQKKFEILLLVHDKK